MGWFALAVVAVGAGVGWRWARCGLARRGGSAAARMVVVAFEGVARRSRSSEAPSGAGQTLSSSSSRDGRDGGGDASTRGRRWHDRASVAVEGRAPGVIGVVVHDAGRRLDAAADVVARVIVARGSARRVVVYDRDGEFARVRGMRALERAFGAMMLRAKDEARALTYALRACDAQRGGLIRHVSGIDRVDDDEMSSDEKNVSLAGEGKRRHVVVDVLGGRDACAALVDAARNADVIDDKDIVDDADVKFTYKPKVERLERWMRERGSFIPPPDAIIVFGETFHLDGFPPWQLHAAELYHERAIETFTERDFDSIIERFARTAQRFGR
jgi:hypothetical protein